MHYVDGILCDKEVERLIWGVLMSSKLTFKSKISLQCIV